MAGEDFTVFIVGVILVITGSLGNNLGLNLVSLAHTEERNKEEKQVTADAIQEKKNITESKIAELNKSKYTVIEECSEKKDEENGNIDVPIDLPVLEKNPPRKEGFFSWRTIGIFIFVAGHILIFASFGFGAQSLLASLEAVQFVSNVFFAKYVHKEKITKRMSIATASIVAGCVLVVVFSKESARLFTGRDLLYLYRNNTAYHAYLCVAGVLWFICHFTYSYYYKVRIKEKRSLWQHSFIEPFTFTISSTIIGTQAVLLSKCMSMLVQLSISGAESEFSRPTVYVILVSWIILVAYWLRRLDVGVALYPPLFIIPVMQVFFIFFALLCGGIYFEEFNEFTVSMFVGFIVGVILILIGVYGMTPSGEPVIPLDDTEDTNVDKIGHIEEGVNVNTDSNPCPPHSITKERRGSEIKKERRGSEGGIIPLYTSYGDSPIKEAIHSVSDFLSQDITRSRRGSEQPGSRRASKDIGQHITEARDSLLSLDSLGKSAVLKPDGISALGLPSKLLPAITIDTELAVKRKKRKVVKRVAGDGGDSPMSDSPLSPEPYISSPTKEMCI